VGVDSAEVGQVLNQVLIREGRTELGKDQDLVPVPVRGKVGSMVADEVRNPINPVQLAKHAYQARLLCLFWMGKI
jgi:hypothetical protein